MWWYIKQQCIEDGYDLVICRFYANICICIVTVLTFKWVQCRAKISSVHLILTSSIYWKHSKHFFLKRELHFQFTRRQSFPDDRNHYNIRSLPDTFTYNWMCKSNLMLRSCSLLFHPFHNIHPPLPPSPLLCTPSPNPQPFSKVHNHKGSTVNYCHRYSRRHLHYLVPNDITPKVDTQYPEANNCPTVIHQKPISCCEHKRKRYGLLYFQLLLYKQSLFYGAFSWDTRFQSTLDRCTIKFICHALSSRKDPIHITFCEASIQWQIWKCLLMQQS